MVEYLTQQNAADLSEPGRPVDRFLAKTATWRGRVGGALVAEMQQQRARKKVAGRTALLGVKPITRGVRSVARSLLAGLPFGAGCGYVVIKRGSFYSVASLMSS
jgi:hypothetical protein